MIRTITFRRIDTTIGLLLCLFASGCGNTVSPPATSFSTPNVGSTFVIRGFAIDSNSEIVRSSEYFDTMIVKARGMAFMGKTNVSAVMLLRGSKGPVITDYYQSEPNGDLSFFSDNSWMRGGHSGWATIALGTKATTSFNSMDTIEYGKPVVQTSTWTYASDRTENLLGHNFYLEGFYWDQSGPGPTGANEYGRLTQWYSPELGLEISADVPPFHLPHNRGWNNGFHSELISMVLK